jgi:nucleoside-diphosphate-sugar epimerase
MTASVTGLALLTGATGFIGSFLAQRLIAEGRPLRLLARDPERLAVPLRGVEWVRADLRDPASLVAAVRGVDTVYHLAANVRTWDRRAEYWADNVEGLRHLLLALRQEAPALRRFVHLSSVDVYGFPQTPCTEECPLQSAGFGYGDSKIAAEALLREAAQDWHLPQVILRPANVMGPQSPFVERVGQELRDGLMLRIDGGAVDAGFLDIGHLVDVLLWAADTPGLEGEVFNVNGAESISWRQFLDDLRGGVAGRGKIIDLPFVFADGLARTLALPYAALGVRREPLLHPLIVRIFGRTCGHSAIKLRRFGAPAAQRSYDEVMEASLAWFRAQSGAG